MFLRVRYLSLKGTPEESRGFQVLRGAR